MARGGATGIPPKDRAVEGILWYIQEHGDLFGLHRHIGLVIDQLREHLFSSIKRLVLHITSLIA